MSSEGGKIPFHNQLWRARKRRGLGQKQVAYLIEKTVGEVSRYEHGVHLPELQTLLALEIVYGQPLRLLFSELYGQLYAQIAKRVESPAALRLKHPVLPPYLAPEQEYCDYEQTLNLPHLSTPEQDKVRAHVTRLAKRLAGLDP